MKIEYKQEIEEYYLFIQNFICENEDNDFIFTKDHQLKIMELAIQIYGIRERTLYG